MYKKMTNEIRLCNPSNFKFLIEYDGNKFTGILAPFVEDLIQAVRRNANVTLRVRSQNDDFGERIGSKGSLYSGCIGLLQKNQSDVMLLPTNYPHEASNVTQGLIMQESALNMINVYYVNGRNF